MFALVEIFYLSGTNLRMKSNSSTNMDTSNNSAISAWIPGNTAPRLMHIDIIEFLNTTIDAANIPAFSLEHSIALVTDIGTKNALQTL